ncbi:ATP-binding protein [Flaviaesturariibacter aridisoli]|uniref:histidine kinase n=1 Tax=Flaviaesturariibacter aridisoli TaxID=2545761 RepID=A0A4R4DXT2_9BACT|nr:ATP-binding protein [Flaviaesturariibacter aridisoli]TCZ68333.1 HAMP domain-containing protein [Flaviaesturariibacter aridisoli]
MNSSHRLPKRALLYTAAALLFLSLLTGIYFHEQPSLEREQHRLESYLHGAEKDFKELLGSKALLQQLALGQENEDAFSALLDKPYALFLYRADGTLVYWNSQRMQAPVMTTPFRSGTVFQSLSNGYFVTQYRPFQLPVDGRPMWAVAMIPVQYRYGYQHSSYLKSYFVHDPEAGAHIQVSTEKTPYVIRDGSTQTLFYLAPRTAAAGSRVDAVTALLRIMAFTLLLAYIHFLAQRVTTHRGKLRGILFLAVVLVAIRALLLFWPGLLSFRQFALFDPTVYSKNFLLRSLGDLLITTLFFCWLTVFTWYRMGPEGRLPGFLQGKRLLPGGIAALFVLMLGTFQFANVVRSLVADSRISFNVIDFFSLDTYTVLGFLVLALLTLSFYYFTRVLYRIIFPAFAGKTVFLYFGLAFMGLLFLTFRSGNKVVLFHMPVLIWLICYTALVSRGHFFINRFRISIAGVLFWIFVFSISLAIVIFGENRQKEFEFRKAMAVKYDELTDPSGEHTLSTALAYLDKDFLAANFPRFQDPQRNRVLRDSIISENIMGYLNRYETRIFVFDEQNNPVNNSDSVTFAELNNLFSVQSRPTRVPDLSYYETAYNQFTYITKRRIGDSSGQRGTFFIVSTPRKYNSEALYPELFRRTGETDAENSQVYAYAIYTNGLLVLSSNKYSFRINLSSREVPVAEYERRRNGDFDELWYRASGNKVVVIAKQRDTLLESITLFSYLFCAFLFLVGVLRLLLFLLQAGDGWRTRAFYQLNIRSQVHGTIIFISIFSFLVIGVATISFFVARYQRNNVDKLSRTAGIVTKELQQRVLAGKPIGASLLEKDSVSDQGLQTLINEIAEIHNVDVNLYDPQGALQVSSEPEVYKRGLLSTRMHPMAWHHLARLREIQFVQEERLSSLRYMSIYAAITNKKGEVYAYLNIPYFLSQIDLNQEISNFLVTIINLNAFIFLIAGIIALFITNRITQSFSLIGDKMRAISLGHRNEPIEWPRNDEIGVLVEQYNRMVRQLEESADALARSEREGAWREMARQVAHEIKNPLTPMKLSIQYLQRAVNANQPNVQQLTTSVAQTLIEQIDHLAKISSDFARFANIGNRNLETFDLHDVLRSLEALYVTNPKIEWYWERLPAPVLLYADRTHMVRLFTNLVTNAVEACAALPHCRITLREQLTGQSIKVLVTDNGEGIPDDMRGKIFTPNFTTKTSGTGLGLAMCKSIVEQAGGRIWFETEKGVGTTFFVELPLAEEKEG